MIQFRAFFKSSVNFVTVFIALIFSTVLWLFQPTGNIPTWIFMITLFSCFALLWLFIIAIIVLHDRIPNYNLTSIIRCTEKGCLCSKNSYLSHESIISFYLLEDGYENLIGYGIISNIQSDGYIQIDPYALPNTVLSEDEGSFIEVLNKNRKKIIIKSIVTKKIIDNMK
ncbi:hypothetical protein [Clostridium estertheticum]|uniref:hypothetical protein n=1 Tax=Clostridium estertheticum TaxID=238834 RepID=UPI001CF453DC|nr:hypothetical protein [Clostridium estertheticum]MCB2356919.1 hypothetical protein [Clostridium estertheticum]WAG44005.1 hypothetical protein LL065_26055 [Clostridium estertheticum]